MTTYGISRYGPPNLYGLSRAVTVVPGGGPLPLVNNAYLIDPFTAMPVDYTDVLLTWTAPDPTTGTPMTEFRLLSSRYGYPVDEDDGNVLLDTLSHPGSSFVDQNVVPGEMVYYGFYINTGSSWVRAGFTACLVPVNHDYGSHLWSYLPEYLRDVQNNELTADAAGNTYLWQFLQIAGWSLNYLKTQYDYLFTGQNSPMKMSLSDLADLAGQLGVPFSGEIPAYYMRKAVDNWSTIMRQRGSLPGIAEHISLLSGYAADLQVSPNIMLDDDQSLPESPKPAPFDPGIPYAAGELVSWPDYPDWVVSQSYIVDNYVQYNGVNYQCIAAVQGVPPTGAVNSSTYWEVASGPFIYKCATAVTALPATAPPGAPGAGQTPNSNAAWTLVYDADAPQNYLQVPGLIGGESTWEVLTAATGATTPNTSAAPVNSLVEGIGLRNPANFTNDYAQNALRVTNRGSSTADTWLRSLSRQSSDVAAGSSVPDPQAVIEHGIPVPQPNPADEWDATVRYGTGNMVVFGGISYLALRASTGAEPVAGQATPEWVPLGTDSRIPLTISAETIQNVSVASAEQLGIYPFVEWYDSWGNLITRAFARTPTAGTAGTPANYVYDSFTKGVGTSLTGRTTDAGGEAWSVPEGGWTIGDASAYPTSSSVASTAIVPAPASATQAVTFLTEPTGGRDSGLIVWYQSATQYWHAGMSGLWYNNGGTFTEVAAYTKAFQPGDRIYVVTNASTPSITVYRNAIQAYNATTGNGQVATVTPTSGQYPTGQSYSGLAYETV